MRVSSTGATVHARVIAWSDTIIQDVHIAFRLLRRTPLSTLVALLSIVLSVGATAVVFAAIKSVLLKPFPYAHPEQLVQLRSNDDIAGPSHTDWIFWNDAEEIIRHTRTLASAGIYRNAVFDLGGTGATPPQALYGLRVTASLFPTLGVSPMLGRNIKPDEDQAGHPEEIILSYGLWTKRFGADKSIVGRSIEVNRHKCLVIGVMPPDFNFPLRRAATHTPESYVEFWAPMRTGGPNTTRGGMGAVARLRSGISLAEARQDLATISTVLKHEFPSTKRERTLRLGLMRDREIGTARNALLLLLAAALMFLLVGCANIANLLLARGLARQREISVRIAIGAGAGRVIRQLLTESCVLSVLGGIGAYLLSLVAWRILSSIVPVNIPRLGNTRADWTILIFAIALSFVNGILFAIAPAIRLVRSATPAAVYELGTRGSGSARENYTRAFLVTAEVAISVVLVLVGAQLLGSFLGLISSDPGFQAKRVLAAVVLPNPERYKAPSERAAVYERFLNAMYTIPGVELAGTIDALPFSGENHGGFVSAGKSVSVDRNDRSIAEIDIIGGEYLQAMGVRLLSGRWFREDETQNSSNTIIVNDVLAKHRWSIGGAIGQEICIDCTPERPNNLKQVVGVVSTLRHAALDGPLPQNVYLSGNAFANADFLVVRTDRPIGEMDRAIRRAIARVDPDQPVLLSASLQSLMDDSIADRRFIVTLLTSTGSLALLMALAGVYGVTSYTTSRRTQEIGVRMAVGATPGSVQILVFRQAFVNIAAGLSGGACLALVVARILGGSVAGLEAHRPAQFGLAAAVMTISATLACWIPARRAAKLDPIRALRQD